MAGSQAKTVDEYLAELPPDRREVVSTVRDVVRANLPEGVRETMNWGMISYEIPLERFPGTYNGQPLMYAALAAQKNHYALYLTGLYMDEQRLADFRAGFERAGKKLDIGKSCVRFKRLQDIPLDVVGGEIGADSVDGYIARYRKARER